MRGFVNSDSSIPSKPITEMSSGTFLPMSSSALIVPTAIISDKAKMAVISLLL